MINTTEIKLQTNKWSNSKSAKEKKKLSHVCFSKVHLTFNLGKMKQNLPIELLHITELSR